MAAASAANKLKALQERVVELEKQLRELKARLDGQTRLHWPDRPHTEEEEIAFHEGSEWVREYIRKEREKDLKRVNAEIDRQIAREKKATARAQKGKSANKTRRAG